MKAEKTSFMKSGALSILQFVTDNVNTFKYISLAKALRKNYIEVKEIDQSGRVNNLSLVNKSKKFIFISDGDILTGAKQNRVMNTSVLVYPESTLNVPVSCVERGRWRYSQREFSDSEFSAPVKMRGSKAKDIKQNLKINNRYFADQSKVWSEVNEYERVYSCNSDTSNLSDIFYEKRQDIESLIKEFKPDKNSNGLAIFVYNKLVNLEIYNRKKIYIEYFAKLLKSAAFDLVFTKRCENKITESEAHFKTNDFMNKHNDIKFDIHKGVGAGTEKRFETQDFTGFELDYENIMIHIAALSLMKE